MTLPISLACAYPASCRGILVLHVCLTAHIEALTKTGMTAGPKISLWSVFLLVDDVLVFIPYLYTLDLPS
jgi:hypothetical protein